MAQSILELILQAKKQGGDVVKQASSDLAGFVGSVAAASKALLANKDVQKDASGALHTFGVDLDALKNPLTTTAELLKESVTAAANWGDSMGDLAQLTGGTVRETSQMAASLELVGVKTATLEQALKSMTKNGLALNMSSLKDLSRQYQALEDPIARNEFLFKSFGKAGLEMAEIMGKSADELDRLERAAKSSGKVIGEEAAANAEEFNLQMAIFSQKVEGAKIALGGALIPAVLEFINTMERGLTVGAGLSAQLAFLTGQINGEELAARQAAIAQGDLAAGYLRTWQAAQDVTTVTNDQVTTYATLRTMYTDVTTATGEFSAAMEYTLTATDRLTVGMKSYNTQLLFTLASEGMTAEQALNLGVQLGVVDTRSLLAAESVAALKAKYDTNADGALSASEAARGYSSAVAELARNLDSIPEQKKVRIEIESYGGNLALPTPGAQPGNAVPRALGGPTFAGVPNIVNESALTRPEVFVSDRNGFMLTRQDAQAALSSTGGAVNVYVTYAPTMSLGDEVEFETRVIPLIKSKLRL